MLPPPIAWTSLCEFGHHLFSINLTNFKGTDLSKMKILFFDFGCNQDLDASQWAFLEFESNSEPQVLNSLGQQALAGL